MDRRWLGILICLLAWHASHVQAQSDAPRWRELPARLQGILGPIEADWAGMDAEQRRKWVAIAQGYERMTPGEQQNLLSRMRTWAALSPRERQLARDRYREWLSIPPEERETLRHKWEQYQNLPPDEKPRSRAPGTH